ncbi:aldo/keto reductase [Thalassovita sp.]|jgi:aryl-alcohol dehydrogenase-like predicted oxidoreductase|uniref:aldo/keto reductase n=1 Tax=Thalassovita sp. TaxID=1979401 RepID=UPI003B5C55FE
MKLRTLGKNGPEISALGIGAMSFSEFYGPTTEENSFAILSAALDAGVTHIDTANVYGMGRSERAIGQFLKDNPGTREQFHIATKAAITKDENGDRCFKNSLEHLESELDKSLEKLGVDCVDLFYVHRRQADMPIEEVAGHMNVLKQKGKIKAIGLSEIAPYTLRRAATEAQIDAVQNEYSLATRLPEMGLIQACAEVGASLVAFSPVGRALLTDDPIPLERIPELAFLKVNPRFIEPNYSLNLAATDPLRAYAAELGVPTAALAIAWVLAQGEHIIAIPGTRSTGHFNELVTGANLDLTAEQLAKIEKILPVGWAYGDRYSVGQNVGPERYC